MLHSYKSFLMISESREEKLEKQRKKIHSFLKFEPIIDYVFDKVVDEDGTKGLKYTTWFCDKVKEQFIDWLTLNLIKILKNFSEIRSTEIKNFLNDKKYKFFDNYLKTGQFEFKLSEDEIKMLKNSIIKLFKEMIAANTPVVNTSPNTLLFLNAVISTIIDWLKSPIRDEEVNLSEYKTLKDAYNKSSEWHANLHASGYIANEIGTILLQFDDGYYWIDLETNSSREEADAMGHCGTTNNGKTLYSLRKKQSPHVTAAIGGSKYAGGHPENDTVFQMKGRNNERPIAKYHPYIVELLAYPNVSDNVKLVTEFDKILDFSTTEYQPKEDFHISDLTAEQILDLKKRNPELISNMGLAIKYKLYTGGHLSKEELIKGYEDLKIIDNEIHFIVKDWTEFDKSIFKTDRDHRGGWQMEVLEGTYLDRLDYDLKFDYDYEYDKIKPYVFKEIIDLIDKKGNYVVYYTIGDDEEKELILSQNMSLNTKEDDIIIKTPEGYTINFEDLLSPGSKSVWSKKQKKDITAESDDLDELKNIFNRSYSMAQSLADEGAAWDAVTKAIENKIGPIFKRNEKYWWFDDGIHFKLDFGYITDILNSLEDINYKSILDIINNIPSDPDEFLIDVDVPYNGWNGTIDADTLSEEIINRLDEV